MSDGRTERPTPRRLREARRRGEVAVSRELCAAAALLGGLAALAGTGPATARLLLAALRRELASAAAGAGEEPWPAMVRAAVLLARTALVPCCAAAACCALVGAVQTRGLFAPRALAVRLERLHPGRNLPRLVSARPWATAAFGMVRTALALVLAWLILAPELAALAGAPRLAAPVLLRLAARLGLRTAALLGLLAVAYGALDLALAARRRRRELKMTRSEILRETREDQGDPQRKLERRRVHRALAEAPPLAGAACLVVNPTHLAVALAHDAGSDDPPVVVAKGAGGAGARLRSEARRFGVPVVRDVALARALYRLAEVGDAIPVELYDAAAAVLVHVHGRATGDP